jgi:CMP-N-acetylneuraminic acid synthetase
MPDADLGRVLGLIPARGGSKGIPRKNIALVAGKPLLAWSVDSARASRAFDRLIVSTEDSEIAAVSRGCGAEVPFVRPAELSRDDTPGIDPVLHALEALSRQGYRADWVMLLQPTSPLRAPEDIQGALELRTRRAARSIISVCEATHPPSWLRRLDPEGQLLEYFPEEEDRPTRQALPKAYALNGAIYLAPWDVLDRERTFSPARTFGYVMPRERSLDVDSPWDLELADLVLRHRRSGPT